MTTSLLGSLEEILVSIQHHDQSIRRSGEIQYHLLQSYPDYVDVITKYASDGSKPVHCRHLVILLLNQQISKDWNSFSKVSKGTLVQFSLQGCNDTVTVIRHAAMITLSKIAFRSSEVECGEILKHLSTQLLVHDIIVVISTLRCLCTIAEEELCFKRVHDIIQTVNPSSFQLLRYASKLMRLCVQKFSAARMACVLQEEAVYILEQFLPAWCKLAIQWLNKNTDIADICSSLPIILELLRSLATSLEAFPDECGEIFPDSMRSAWSLLCTVRDQNQRRHVISSINRIGPIDHSGYISDGDRVDLNSLIIQLFELLTIGLSYRSFETKAFLGGDLDQLIGILAEQMELTDEQQEQWKEDGNEFVASEQEESSEFSVRHSGAELMALICKGGKEKAFKYVFSPSILIDLHLFSSFNSSTSSASLLDASVILRLESIIWCLGCLGGSYMKYVKYEEKYSKRARDSAVDDVNGGSVEAPVGKEAIAITVINSVAKEEVSKVILYFMKILLIDPFLGSPHPEHSVLRGRMVWLLSIYIRLFDSNIVRVITESCLRVMDEFHPLAVKLQGCRALGIIVTNTIHLMPKDFNMTGTQKANFGVALIESTLKLIPSMTQSTLHYSMELITVGIKQFLTHAEGESPLVGIGDLAIRIAQVGLGILSVYRVDPLLLDVTKEMLCALSCAGGESVLAVYVQCTPQLEQWLIGGTIPIFPDPIDLPSSDEDRNDGNSYSDGQGVFRVPASLVDVSIEIISKICTSPSLSLLSCTGHTQTGIVLKCFRILLSPLNAPKFCCRRECMQAINTMFSYYEGEVGELFSESSSQPSSSSSSAAAIGFALSLAELLLQSTQMCEKDPGSMGECAGPLAGLLCHLLTNFKDVLDISVTNSLLSATLQCLKNTPSTYVKNSLLMGLIHLFARNAPLMANPSSPLLGFLPSKSSGSLIEDGNISALAYIIDEWCSLHVHLTTRYSGTVSTLGLLELIKIFSKHSSNHGYALKVLSLALSTLPRILLCPEGTDDDIEGGLDGYGGQDDEEDDDVSDDSDQDWESEYDDDDMGAMTRDNYDADIITASPFAPAEIPPSTDPLSMIDLQGSVIDLLSSLKISSNTGMFPAWMNSLSAEDQHLVQALQASR